MSTTQFDGVNGDLVIASGTAPSITSDSGSIAASQALSTSARTEIVFIEDNVGDLQSLVQQVGAGREVVILDSTKDGLQQIAHTLEGRTGIDALHIISHGSAGSANLGALSLDSGSVGTHQAELATIGASLSAGGDILLYGCDIGSGAGQQFVNQLAVATGADVAASNDLTGSAALGGDWNLEVSSGPVETASLAPASFEHVLMSSSSSVNVDFEDTAAFSLTSSEYDIQYSVAGTNGTVLNIHSLNGVVHQAESNGNDAVITMAYNGQPAEISLTNGQAFSVSSIDLGVQGNLAQNGLGDSAQFHLTVVGVGANGQSIDPTSVTLTSDGFSNNAEYVHVVFDHMTNVKSIQLMYDVGSSAPTLYVDNLVIGPAVVKPDAPAIQNLEFNSDSGTKGDNITNDTTPTVEGSAAAGSSVHLYDTNGAEIGTGVANDSGYWSVTSTTSLDEGSHDLTAKVIDGSGTASDASAPFAIRIDTQAPGSPTPYLNPDSDTGSPIDHVTGDTTLTIEGSQKYDSDLIKLFEVADGKQPAELKEFHAVDGQWSITTDELLPGVHHFVTQATDAAGNVGEFSEQLDVTVVTDAPTAHAVSATLEKDSGVSSTDFVTKVDTQSISGTLSAAPADGERVQVSTDGGQNWNDADVDGTNWTLATTLQYGENELQVRVINAVDSAGPVFSKDYVLDQDAPGLTITSDHYQLKAGETATIKFDFNGDDPGSSFSLDNVQVSGGTLSAMTGGDGVYTATFTPTPGLDVTNASISVADESYTDLAGNPGTGASLDTLLFDTLAPAAPIGLALADNSDNGAFDNDLVTSLSNPTISGQALEGSTVKLYDSNGAQIGEADVMDGSWKATTTTLEKGEHHIFARAFDNVGNPSEVSAELKITVDTTPPAVSAPTLDIDSDSGVKGDGITNAVTPLIHGTAEAGSLVTLYEGARELGSDTADINGNWSITSMMLGEGPHSLTAKAVDAAGNVGEAVAPLDIRIDTTPSYGPMPNLDPASDTGISNEDGVTGDTTPTIFGSSKYDDKIKLFEVVNVDGEPSHLVQVGETTAIDGQWSITTSELIAGPHHLVTTATDAAGNEGGVSDELLVTIVTDKPSTHAVGITLEKDSGASHTDFITNVATQSVSGTLSAEPAPGDRVQVSTDGQNWTDANVEGTSWTLATTLQTGSHELQVRVLNQFGNSGEVLKQAYTLDQASPTVEITSNVDHLKAGDKATITFTFSDDPGASIEWNGQDGNLQVSGGTLSPLEGTGTVRTAIFTPDAGVDNGVAGISVGEGAYVDLAGNYGAPASLESLRFDTLAPAAPAVPHLVTDNGRFENDHITSIAKPTFNGLADNGSTVSLVDTDTGATLGESDVVDGAWSVTAQDALKDGVYHVAAIATDAAGNVSELGESVAVTIDTTAPTVTITSDVSKVKIGQTATFTFTFSDDPGLGFSRESIIAGGAPGSFGELTGTGLTRTMTFTPETGIEGGLVQVGVSQGSFTDAAGNVGKFTPSLPVSVDTLAPAAPSAPTLAASSDTGTVGDGHTETASPAIEGTAEANALVTLYDGEIKIGSGTADANGKWSITTTNLDVGNHVLVATQSDAAGNVSAVSSSFALTIDQPPAPPVNLVDGMPVDSNPVVLGNGVIGTQIDVPVVTSGRAETTGASGVADIPLATKGGGNVLLAQLPDGVGLSSSGANVGSANALEFLISSIKAATPTHAAADQGHLTSNGSSFLAGLAASTNLLVQTVTPVSSKAGSTLTLTGATDDASQDVALVVDTSKLAAGSTIQLQHVDFAAIIGAANVVAGNGNTTISGDAADQHITVDANGNNNVFAGGGNDTLSFGQAPSTPVASAPATGGVHASIAPASGTTVLHGGQDSDSATFTGARADYNVEQHNGYLVVSDKAAPDAKALVVNVEHLQFSDASVTVENNADMNVLSGMYQSMFGRQADMKGIEFFADANQAGISMGSIALNMVSSAEYLAGHDGMNGDAAHDVGLLYQALFNREADSEGLAFWTNNMSHGMSLEDVATNMVQSVEMVGHQRAAIDWDFIV